jgi:hypothetical protein
MKREMEEVRVKKDVQHQELNSAVSRERKRRQI